MLKSGIQKVSILLISEMNYEFHANGQKQYNILMDMQLFYQLFITILLMAGCVGGCIDQ